MLSAEKRFGIYVWLGRIILYLDKGDEAAPADVFKFEIGWMGFGVVINILSL